MSQYGFGHGGVSDIARETVVSKKNKIRDMFAAGEDILRTGNVKASLDFLSLRALLLVCYVCAIERLRLRQIHISRSQNMFF